MGQEMSPQDVAMAIIGQHMSVVMLSLRRQTAKATKTGTENSPSCSPTCQDEFFQVAARRYFRISVAAFSSSDTSLETPTAAPAFPVMDMQQDRHRETDQNPKRQSSPSGSAPRVQHDHVPLSFALPSLPQDPSSLQDNPGSKGMPRRNVRLGASTGTEGARIEEDGEGGGGGHLPVLDDVGRVLLGDVRYSRAALLPLEPVFACE